MWIDNLVKWIESTAFSETIRTSDWMFPDIEIVHVLGISFVVGSIAMLDLRLLGVIYRDRPVTHLAKEMLPWTWSGYVVAVMAGVLLFLSQPTKYYLNLPFDMKFVLMALAGANMAIFHHFTYRKVADWDLQLPPPPAARIAGALSLTLWLGVVTFGRWIGFTVT
jgi:hypothetical protein